MIIKGSHPSTAVTAFLSEAHPSAKLEMSIYEHIPQSILDKRYSFSRDIGHVNEEFLKGIKTSLAPNEELAAHSRLIINKKVFHIPMIDFCCTRETLSAFRSTTLSILPKKICNELLIYDSGNSLHGYALTLIPGNKWIDYLGRLLLLNLPDRPPLVDSRWVGHRLRAGYASLRWSNNTSAHRSPPKLIATLDTI